MKKMMLLAAMMVGTASAQTAATGAITFNTKIVNVCAISGNAAGGGNLSNVPAPVSATVNTPSYDALQNPTTTSSTGNIGYLQCTTGTPLTLETRGTGGTTTTSSSSNADITNTGDMNLVNGSNALQGSYSAKLSKNATSNNGDVWQGEFSFTPDAGQWNVPAETYSGVLDFTITYN